MSEHKEKQQKILSFLDQHNLDALLMLRASSFAWATCGSSSYINTASSEGLASLLVTRNDHYLITTNIEAPRYEKEEKLADQGWKLYVTPWHKTIDAVADLAKGMRLGADENYPGSVDLSGELARFRSVLSSEEQGRFRELSRLSAQAMNEAMHGIQPGMTEYQIAGLLAGASEKRGVQAIVNLIATDERIYNYRHPLPTSKKMEKYAMVVMCGRKWGLVCSLTRLVHFGAMPADLRRKMEAVARIDAAIFHATRPGKRIDTVFGKAVDAYTETGFPDEWKLHHQGGPAGFEAREFLATPESRDMVSEGQTYAWNPSITGVKSEDTILVGEEGNEVLTEMVGWPELRVVIEGHEYMRPIVLENR